MAGWNYCNEKECFWKASIPHLAIPSAKLLQKFDIRKDFGKKLKNILVFGEILVYERECANVISVGLAAKLLLF